MKRCFSTLGCPDLTLPQAFALAAAHGLDGIEIRAVAGSIDVPAYLAQTYGSPAALAKHAATEAWLPVPVLGTSFRLLDAAPADREKLVAFAPWADALRVPWLRVFDGGSAATSAELEQAAADLAWWRAERETHGWTCDLLVETHDALITSERLARFFAAAPDVALLWDSHHTWRRGGESPATTWQVVRDHARHLHVKDSVTYPGAKTGFRYVPPGEGGFPMAELRAQLSASGYDGWLSFEWERLWHRELAPLEQALESARRHGWW